MRGGRHAHLLICKNSGRGVRTEGRENLDVRVKWKMWRGYVKDRRTYKRVGKIDEWNGEGGRWHIRQMGRGRWDTGKIFEGGGGM